MYFKALVFALLFALFFASLLAYGFKRKGPGPLEGMLFFLMIIFMFSWAIGSWLSPVGPVYHGVPWLGYLYLAFMATLLLGVLIPPQKPPHKAENRPVSDYELFEKNAAVYPLGITFGYLFWITMIFLLIVGIARIFFQV